MCIRDRYIPTESITKLKVKSYSRPSSRYYTEEILSLEKDDLLDLRHFWIYNLPLLETMVVGLSSWYRNQSQFFGATWTFGHNAVSYTHLVKFSPSCG